MIGRSTEKMGWNQIVNDLGYSAKVIGIFFLRKIECYETIGDIEHYETK